MPKVSSYTLLAASGIDRTADSLYVVDATGPSSKRATVAGLWDAGLTGSHALLGNVTFTGSFDFTLSGVGFASTGGAFSVSAPFPEIEATDSMVLKTPAVVGGLTRYGQPFCTDGATSGIGDFMDLRETVIVQFTANLSVSRSLTDSDYGVTLLYSGSSAITLTVPTTLRTGFVCRVIQLGTGKITFAADTGASVNAPQGQLSTGHQYATVNIRKVSSTAFILDGNLGS